MVTNQLIDAALYLGVVSGVITILDLVLSASKKKSLKSNLETVWLWLEYKRLLDFYRVERGAEFLIPITAIISFLIMIILPTALFMPSEYFLSSIVYLAEFILPFIFLVTFTNALSFVLFPAIQKWYVKHKTYILNSDDLFDIAHRSIGFSCKPIFGVLFFIPHPFDSIKIAYLLFAYPLTLLNGIWLTLACWAIIAFILKKILTLLSLFIYKIVSYPAGPMMFISTLLAAIASFIKIFTDT